MQRKYLINRHIRQLNDKTEIDLSSAANVDGKIIVKGAFTTHIYANPAKTIISGIKTTHRYYEKKSNGYFSKALLTNKQIEKYENSLSRIRLFQSF